MTYEIKTEDLRSYLPRLRICDRVLLSGTIYTSRDAAHKRIFEALDSGAPVRIGACIILAWVVSALVWLELYRRHEETKRQRRFNKCLQYRNRKAG